MLSTDTERHIRRLLAAQDTYLPSDETRTALADKTLIMLVGPTGAGKSTVMRELTKLDPSISIVGTITTREPRPDDHHDRYTFYDHNDEGLAPLFNDISTGKLVQYVVNPFNHQIYGSSLSDYPSTTNVGDYFSSVVDDFSKYGFGRIVPVTIVTPADSWVRRFDERFPIGHPQRENRRQEAIESLVWSLGTHQAKQYFVLNPDDVPKSAAQDILSVLKGVIPPQQMAQGTAVSCLKAIRATKV